METPVAHADTRSDVDAEKLLPWLQSNLTAEGMTERAIVDRRDEFSLTERKSRGALARLRKAGAVIACREPQYGDKGRTVERFRLRADSGPCDK